MEEQLQANQPVIIETVDDGEVGYLPPVEDTTIIETIPEASVMKVEGTDIAQQSAQQLEQQPAQQTTTETLPVVYVADQLPNTGTDGYGFLSFASIGLIFLGVALLRKCKKANEIKSAS